MLKSYLLIALRNLFKNKLHIFINIFGMSIAVACCIVAYFNYDYNVSFDTMHKNASTIYRVGSVRIFQNEETVYGFAPVALGNVITQNFPDVDAVVRYAPDAGNFRVGTELYNNDITHVDPAFFDLFTFEFIEGSGEIRNAGQIVISDQLSKKYFGKERALGKALTQMLDSGKTKEYVVSGVFKEPASNNSFFSQAYDHYDNEFTNSNSDYTENSWHFRNTLFIQINDPARIPAIQAQLTPYAENNNKIREDFIIKEFVLEPFEGMAVRDEFEDRQGNWTRDGSPLAAVVGLGMMAIFILLIACFNLTNTAVAISSRRLKEIGIRKVMGSARKSIIFQFIGETTLVCFLALVLGVVIGETFLLPAFNKLWPDLKLVTDYWGRPNFLIFMVITLLFTALVAGAYPAFYISRFQPVAILKGTQKFGGTNWITRGLLCLQFVISLCGIVCSFAFTDNAEYQRAFDMGFNRKGLIFANIYGRSEYETYRNALAGNPDIISIAGTQHHIYASGFSDPIRHEEKEIEVDIMDVSADYIPTVDLVLKQGRNFDAESETDRKESVIITEDLARKLGMKEALGKEIVWNDTTKYYVVGVIQDLYNNGLWRKMDPVMMRYGHKDNVNHILVKASADKLVSVNKYMEAKWKEIFPHKLYNGHFMNEEMVEADTVNNNLVIMFVFLGVVALILSATGLFTLVSLNIIKKMKEIGVRKVLGASISNITGVINREFVFILIIACLLGAPLGWFLSAALMDGIWDYYQSVSVTSMITSAVILIVAAALSIGFKIYNTSKLSPSNILRVE